MSINVWKSFKLNKEGVSIMQQNKQSNVINFSEHLNKKIDNKNQLDNYNRKNISKIIHMLYNNIKITEELKTDEMYNIFLTLLVAMEDFENQKENLTYILDACEEVYNIIEQNKRSDLHEV
jgi:hypothetical protein